MKSVKVSLSVSRKAKEGAKPFFYNVGSGHVVGIKGEEIIEISTLPGVVVSGGLLRVEKDQHFPATFPKRMDVYVQVEHLQAEQSYIRDHLIGSAFSIDGKEGMYSLSFPDEISFTGAFIVKVPKTK